MRVKAVTAAGRQDVYNMEVEDTHDFAVQGGVIVHNCADECRYVCMARPINPPAEPAAKPRAWDPLSTDEIYYDPYGAYRRG